MTLQTFKGCQKGVSDIWNRTRHNFFYFFGFFIYQLYYIPAIIRQYVVCRLNVTYFSCLYFRAAVITGVVVLLSVTTFILWRRCGISHQNGNFINSMHYIILGLNIYYIYFLNYNTVSQISITISNILLLKWHYWLILKAYITGNYFSNSTFLNCNTL